MTRSVRETVPMAPISAVTRIVLGAGDAGEVTADLPVLIDTRALIQAQSGAGKSWFLRRLLEESHGRVQQLVLDPEGEFATLRERYDYVIAGKGGDCAADPRSAKLLARRLLELGVSAVCDIYELRAHDRLRFVRAFLEALVEAPRTLRHPVLVVVDEAHLFAPQTGQAESTAAVIDLCTRGRKRGLCAVLATQRLSKLHKDAAAELRNVFIGATGLDLDQQRAADMLGFDKAQRLALRYRTRLCGCWSHSGLTGRTAAATGGWRMCCVSRRGGRRSSRWPCVICVGGRSTTGRSTSWRR